MRKKEDDYLGPSRGWAKIFHKIMMFILWPLRRPLWFLLILFIMFMAPTFMGVKPAEVHLWYWNKLKTSSTQVSAMVSDKTKNMMPDLPNVEMPSFSVNSTANKTAPAAKVVDMPVKETRRKMFEKAKSIPVAVDIMKQPKTAEPAMPQFKNAAVVNTPAVSITAPAKKKLALVYVDKPKNIVGYAQVTNANELLINKETIFLYGIYVDPNTSKGQEAKVYLDKTIGTQPVSCSVNAYTYQGIATGICRVGTLNINKALVENGFSKNVALD